MKTLSELPSSAWSVGYSPANPVKVQERSGVDILVATEDASAALAREVLRTKLASKAAGADVIIFDDAVQMTVPDGPVFCFGVYSMDSLSTRLADYSLGERLEGESRVWAAGGWLPESLCADLYHGELMTPPNQFTDTVHDYVRAYPSGMRNAIRKLSLSEMAIKLRVCSQPPEDRQLEWATCYNEVLLSSVRYVFSTESVYLRGYKRLGLQSQKLSTRGKEMVDLFQCASFNVAHVEECLFLVRELVSKGKEYDWRC